ncbi:MAG: transcriptional repressor [Epsilonproteobacteria bacterium]|nr:transcriptional repressor [Campylobacterota bacterium]
MRDYIGFLQGNNLKATFQRISILKSIDKHGHMNIDEIYDDVKEQNPTLSLATIYKNIILMQENNILVEVPIVNKKSKYEIRKSKHIHYICLNCATIEDYEISFDEQVSSLNLPHKESFEVTDTQINLYGYCSKCH